MADEAPKTTATAASELLTSAKVVATTAKQEVSEQGAKVAGAAGDLLGAAKTGAAGYVDTAQGYVHKTTAPAATEKKEEEKSSGDGVAGGLGNMAKGIGGFFKK